MKSGIINNSLKKECLRKMAKSIGLRVHNVVAVPHFRKDHKMTALKALEALSPQLSALGIILS